MEALSAESAADLATHRRIRKSPQLALISLHMLIALRVLAQFPQPPTPHRHASSDLCSMPGLAEYAGRKLKPEDLLDSYNAQAALIHSLEASAIVRVQSSSRHAAKLRDSRPAPVEIRFLAPAWLRMTGVVPFSARRTFDMWSDGRDFRMLMPEGDVMKFFVGSVNAPPTSSNPRENLRPQMVLEALHWSQAKLAASPGSASKKGAGSQTIEVELTGPALGDSGRAKVEFDTRSGTVSRVEMLDEASKVVTDIDYNDWHEVPNSLDGETSVCFPKRVLVSDRQQDLQVEMKILSTEMNPQLSPGQLQLIPPRGIPVTRIPAHPQ